MRDLHIRCRRSAAMEFVLEMLLLVCLALPVAAQDATVTILHVNDSHSHLLSYGPKDASGNGTLGGLARVATVVERVRAKEPNVLFLHGGDFFVGDFMFQEYLGVPELQLLKSIGLDALVLGNHEFDLYPSTLESVLAAAGFPGQGFPVLSANLDTSADPSMAQFVQPYTIKQIAGLKVGILGLTTDYTNQGSNPAPLSVLPPLPVAQAWVDSLRLGHQCNLVVVLSHLGFAADQQLAAEVNGIDLIVGGHSHTLLSQPVTVGRTLIVQAGEFYGHLGELRLKIHDGSITRFSYKLIKIDATIPADPALQSVIDQLRTGIEADPRFGPVYAQPLARAAVNLPLPLGKGICVDTSLGNLAADALRAEAGTDIAFQPQGFISQSIWAGPITGADVMQAFPYGFDPVSGLGLKLATFRTSGLSILAGLEFALYYMPYDDTFFLHASGLTLAFNSSAGPGQRVAYSEVRINGQPIDPAGTYTVAVPDGVVPFLGQIPGFSIQDLSISDLFIYQVICDRLRLISPAAACVEGRLLDLAPLTPPDEGAGALLEVVALFRADGYFRLPRLADQLSEVLHQCRGHLRGGRTAAAEADLERFRRLIAGALAAHHLTETAAARLSFLAGALEDVISAPAKQLAPAAPVAAQAGAPEVNSLMVPSPCRDRAPIRYRQAGQGPVSVAVVDVLGRVVRTLVHGTEGAGERSVLWDGRDDRGSRLPAGKYFVTMEAGAGRQVRGLLLMH